MPLGRTLPWVVWLALGAVAPIYLALFPQDFPLMDDWTVVAPALDGIDPAYLFEAHNGHRIPFPRLLLALAMRLGGPVAARLLSWLALWAAAAFFLLAARRARGRTHPLDALLPLLLVGPRHAFSYLHASDLHFGLQVMLAGLATWLLMEHARRPRAECIVGAAVAVVAQIGCGVNGIVLAVALAFAFPAVARRRRLAFVFSALVTVAALAAFVPGELYRRPDLTAQVGMLARVAALPLSSWPGHLLPAVVGIVAACLLWIAGGAAALGGTPRRLRSVCAVAAFGAAGSLVTALAVAFARAGAGHDILRHAALSAQFYAFAHLLAVALGRARTRQAAGRLLAGGSTFLLVACAAALPVHVRTAAEVGAWFGRVESELIAASRSGWTSEQMADHFGADVYPTDRGYLVGELDRWRARRRAPFE